MRLYELIIIPKDISKAGEIISPLKIQPTKEQKGSNFLDLEFYAEPEKIEEIKQNLQSELRIIRYMLLKKELRKTQPPPRSAERRKEEEKKPEKKIELGEIDKKLAEIFGENPLSDGEK